MFTKRLNFRIALYYSLVVVIAVMCAIGGLLYLSRTKLYTGSFDKMEELIVSNRSKIVALRDSVEQVAVSVEAKINVNRDDYKYLSSVFKQELINNPILHSAGVTYMPNTFPGERLSGVSAVRCDDGSFAILNWDEKRYGDYTTYQWFIRPTTTGKAAWSEAYQGENGVPMVSYAAPLYDSDNKILAVLTVDVELKHFADYLQDDENVQNIVINREGQIMVSHVQQNVMNCNLYQLCKERNDVPMMQASKSMMAGLSGLAKVKNFEGDDCYMIYMYVPGLDWSSAVLLPENYLANSYEHYAKAGSWHVLIFVLIMLLIGVWLVHSRLKPIDKLTDVAHEVSNLNFDVEVPSANGSGELNNLANAFRIMLNSLRETIHKLKDSEESNKMKSAFVANMSHEIRTPLNAIVGFSEMMRYATSDEDKDTYMKVISDNNEILLRLIDDVLDLSKIESGMVDIKSEEFNLGQTAKEELVLLHNMCKDSPVEVRGVNPYVSCTAVSDKKRIQQVLHNFVSNAIKNTTEGFIEIGYKCVDGGVRIYVTDSGCGISDADKKKIFSQFDKVDEFAQGTGLGLAISQSIVAAMKGKIGFESEEGKGSTFWAWFPCVTRYEEKAKTMAVNPNKEYTDAVVGQTRAIKGKRVLVGESATADFMLMKVMLNGNDVTRGRDGSAALTLAKNHRFDLILLSMNMPQLNGVETLRAIRQFDSQVPVVILADEDDYESLTEQTRGIVHTTVLTKPLNLEELEKKLK